MASDTNRDELPTAALFVYRARATTVRRLCALLFIVLLVGVVPALFDWLEHGRSLRSAGVARWASVSLLMAAVQLIYTVYLLQLPDWSSLWVVALVMLVMAMLYAVAFGLTLFAQGDSPLIAWLEWGDALRNGHARTWSLVMTMGCSLLALVCGVTAVRWRNQGG